MGVRGLLIIAAQAKLVGARCADTGNTDVVVVVVVMASGPDSILLCSMLVFRCDAVGFANQGQAGKLWRVTRTIVSWGNITGR